MKRREGRRGRKRREKGRKERGEDCVMAFGGMDALDSQYKAGAEPRWNNRHSTDFVHEVGAKHYTKRIVIRQFLFYR